MEAKIVVPLALVFLLLAAIPVYAAPPVVETGEIDATVPKDWCAFPIVDHAVGSYRSTSFFDKQGALLKTITQANGTDNLYNPVDDTVVLTGHFNSVDTYNAVTGEWTSSGSWYSIDIPGHGTRLIEAGRYWASKDHSVGVITLDEVNELICAALAVDE
jgi:hypothetical protein